MSATLLLRAPCPPNLLHRISQFQSPFRTRIRAHLPPCCQSSLKPAIFISTATPPSSNGPPSVPPPPPVVLMDLELEPVVKLGIGILGPSLSAFGFLFIVRIVMSWYPKLPVEEFPYVIAYAPTEPILVQTRKIIPPLGGVDVTPVVWFGIISFLNEILVGPQGLLVLLSQQL